MTDEERRAEAQRIAERELMNIDNDLVYESLPVDADFGDYEAVYGYIRRADVVIK